ncbi:MAG: hypothetical protein IPF94_15290 [Betaproteobacteria bacterium]|nr:hypothetical protein [Betaproteobacteria bacterium]
MNAALNTVLRQFRLSDGDLWHDLVYRRLWLSILTSFVRRPGDAAGAAP